MFSSSKTFRNYPCAHRRWQHDGHCAFVHGYSRSFIIWFQASSRTENGFVMDFGQLKEIKAWLTDKFDHTLLLDRDDPLMSQFRTLEDQGACKLTIYDDVGMEGTACYVYNHVQDWVQQKTSGRVSVVSVEVRENDKNSAKYESGGTYYVSN